MVRAGDTVWTSRANHYSRRRPLGGTLRLTEEHLVFVPNALERLFRGRGFETPLSAIASVEVARRRFPRTRMFVHLRDGSQAAFLLTRPQDRARDLDARLSR